MKKNLMYCAVASTLLLAGTAFADNKVSAASHQKDMRNAEQVLHDSTIVFKEIARGPKGELPASLVSNTKCIAVFPNVITAAVVVGGSHGSGVVSCNHDSKWSAPAFISMSGGSLGAQVGGKSTDLVLFLTNDQAVDMLKRGKFTLGADASVAVGTYDKTYDVPKKGVVAYQRTDGAYVGASVMGGTISRDEDATLAYYGKGVNDLSLIDGATNPTLSSTAQSFVSVLPQA